MHLADAFIQNNFTFKECLLFYQFVDLLEIKPMTLALLALYCLSYERLYNIRPVFVSCVVLLNHTSLVVYAFTQLSFFI